LIKIIIGLNLFTLLRRKTERHLPVYDKLSVGAVVSQLCMTVYFSSYFEIIYVLFLRQPRFVFPFTQSLQDSVQRVHVGNIMLWLPSAPILRDVPFCGPNVPHRGSIIQFVPPTGSCICMRVWHAWLVYARAAVYLTYPSLYCMVRPISPTAAIAQLEKCSGFMG